MPEKTMIEAADEIRQAVHTIKQLVEKDYPTRTEIERRFLQKSQLTAKIWTVVVVIATSLIASYFVTISTVSTCFLGSTGDHHPAACNLMPGYEEAQRNNQTLFEQFMELQRRSIKNERRIDNLEHQG